MVIDFHTHTFPDRIAAGAISKMQQASRSKAFTTGTVDALRQSMERAGVDLSVVLPVATNPLKVQSINDLSIQLTAQNDLLYFGCVHPNMENPCKELDRIANAGLKGIKIDPLYQDTCIDNLPFLRILDRAAQLGLIVVMHAGDDIGFPGMVRCAPHMIRNALKQVGNVSLVAAHMGGWKNWDTAEAYLADTSVFIDTSFSLGEITPYPPDAYSAEERKLLSNAAFCRLVRAFGSERVLFGTDSPWTDQTQSKQDLLNLPLSENAKQNILCENAKRLLRI